MAFFPDNSFCLFVGVSLQPTFWFNARLPRALRVFVPQERLLEIDNYSEEQTLHYAKRFTEEAHFLHVVVQIDAETASVRTLQPLLRRFMKQKHATAIWQAGQHPFFERIGQAFPVSQYQKFNSEAELLPILPTLLCNFPS